MKFFELTCPHCNATLQVEEGRNTLYCSYCGNRLLLDDEEVKHTYRTIDEARIREAEIEGKVRLKELELKEKKMRNRKLFVTVWIAVMLFIGLIGLIASAFGAELASTAFLIDALLFFYGIMMLMITIDTPEKSKSSESEIQIESPQKSKKSGIGPWAIGAAILAIGALFLGDKL